MRIGIDEQNTVEDFQNKRPFLFFMVDLAALWLWSVH